MSKTYITLKTIDDRDITFDMDQVVFFYDYKKDKEDVTRISFVNQEWVYIKGHVASELRRFLKKTGAIVTGV